MKTKNMEPVFCKGNLVCIRPREEILITLDSLKKLDGCLFMDQMWNYCGQSYKILKVVKNILDERLLIMFQPKAPVYILDGLICEGKLDTFQHTCDHSCFFLWHEKWLKTF